ncbi:MAG: quinone-dependent dihydroorotate dehydrogenase [Candidatus Pacebacteria bacterium]|nr:quinone-dependent dihydroorotate dehydrogenase [Candidatus Paceibacterota bacterium]
MAYGNHSLLCAQLYRRILKPIAFRRNPEDVHDAATRLGSLLGEYRLGRFVTRCAFSFDHPALRSTIAGINFRNPIGLAAGFDKNARLCNILPDVGFGFAEIGSITGQQCAGNSKPRLWRMTREQALQVHYGLMNDGADAIAPRFAGVQQRIALGISAAKTNSPFVVSPEDAIADYCKVLHAFRDSAAYFTLNISCPNAFGGQPFTDPVLFSELLSAAENLALRQPVFVKLSPDLDGRELEQLIKRSSGKGVTGYICTNLTKAYKGSTPGRGGVSGKIVQPLADAQLERVARITRGEKVLIGVGGVFTAEDAYKKIRLGASLVQLITGMVYQGPQLIGQLNYGLVELLHRDGHASIGDAVGSGLN